jgi:glycosyltransferase involved in cell wall biosynthesis
MSREAYPEYVEDGGTGLLAARGDALARVISRVLDDPALAYAIGEAGRQRVLERFTWEASARRLAKLIESLSPADGAQSKIVKIAAPERPASEVGAT